MALSLKDLDPVKDASVLRRYLQYTIDLNEEILCFVKESEIRFSSRLLASPADDGSLLLEFPSEVISPENFLAAINRTVDRQITLSFKAQDTLFMVATQFRTVQPKHLKVLVIMPGYKLQRRSNLRFRPSEEVVCIAKLKSEIKPYDVSAGGFSFIGSEADLELYPKGLSFEKFSFEVNGESFEVSAKVATASKLPQARGSTGTHKFGLKFVKIPPRLEQILAREAYSYTQRIFARRI